MIREDQIRVRSQRLTLGAVASLLMLAALDQTIVTTALPSIVADLGNLNQLSWIVTAYLLTATVSAPVYGKLGDILGRKIMMQVAVVIFVFGSLIAASAKTMNWILFARAIQGLGGGGLFVLAFTVVADVVPSRSRGKVQGLFAAVFGASSIVGPIAGGFIVETISWHWIFLINLPIGLCAMLILNYSFNIKPIRKKGFSLDYLGAILLAIFLCSLIILTTSANKASLSDYALFWLLGLLCITSLILFIFVEYQAVDAILPLQFFKINNFIIYALVGLLSSCILFSILTFLPFYLQVAKNFSPTGSGLQIIALTAGIIFGTIVSGYIMNKTGRYKFIPFFGAICLAIGLLLLSTINTTTSPTILTIYLLAVGVGLGPQLSVITTAVQNSAPPNQLGVATAALTLFRQIGSSVGISIITWLFISKFRTVVTSNSNTEGILIENQLSLENIANAPNSERLAIINGMSAGIQSVLLATAILAMIIMFLSLMIKELALKTSVESNEKTS